MENNIDAVIHEAIEEFEKIPTTEDTRTGIGRRLLEAKDFPFKDNSGNVIPEDRRSQEDRRNLDVDIDDISEYTQQILIKSAEYIP